MVPAITLEEAREALLNAEAREALAKKAVKGEWDKYSDEYRQAIVEVDEAVRSMWYWWRIVDHLESK
jgi:hypothetical protein